MSSPRGSELAHLPRDLTALIHHVELSNAGWRDRTLEMLLLASLSEAGKSLSRTDLLEEANLKLPGPLGRAQAERVIDALLEKGSCVESPDGRVGLAESAKQEIRQLGNKVTQLEAFVSEAFDAAFRTLDEAGQFTWEEFRDEFLVPLVSELGARTYELISGEGSGFSGSESYVRFLHKVPRKYQAAASDRISRFLGSGDPDVRAYVLRLLNTAFLVQAVSIPEESYQRLIERTKKPLCIRVLELTRFGGHLTTYTGGVHDAEEKRAVPAGVSAADR